MMGPSHALSGATAWLAGTWALDHFAGYEQSPLAVAVGTDEDRREWAMTMMLMARALERLGDNAVDIGEQVAFVETGLFREFSDASRRPGAS